MASVEELTAALRETLKTAPAQGSIRVDLGEAGVIRAEGFDADNEDREADCTLAISKADLDAVLAGRLDPVEAMNAGRLQLAGDVAAAIAIQPVLMKAWMPLGG